MKNHFQNKGFFKYVISEFKNRKKSKSLLDTIKALILIYVSLTPNYFIQKEWNLKYISIQDDIIHFYPDLEVQFEGENPSFKTQLFNHEGNRISFLFNRTHIAITSHALHFFPFSTPNDHFVYKTLEDNFKLTFNHNALSKSQQFKENLSFITLQHSNQKTIITLNVKALKDSVKLIVDQIIMLPENVTLK